VLLARRGAPSRAASTGKGPPSAVARFVRQFDAQLREVIHGNHRRLASLLVLEALAYVMMAVEVWTVLWLTPTPVTLIGAFAVETFTRVASMASAFIPANLGALEASNVAAAVAVHAVGGAAALALLRRVRGIVWCAGGFLIYPRWGANARTVVNVVKMTPDHEPPREKGGAGDRTLVLIEGLRPAVRISDRLGGLPIGERILRAAVRGGYTRVFVWTPDQRAAWNAVASRMAALEVVVEDDEAAWRSTAAQLDPRTAITMVAPGIVPSPSVLESAGELPPDTRQPLIEVAGDDSAHTGVYRALPDGIARPITLATELTRAGGRSPAAAPPAAETRAPLSLSVATHAELAMAEQRLRESIFKPTDGPLGRLNRRISMPISLGLIRWMRFSANAMSVLIIGLGLYAGWLFSRGDYVGGVLAALVSWAASVLDGCDGELARLQYTDSPFGCWLDTLGDYVYYLAIFIGLTIGAVRQTGWAGFWWIGGAMLAGMLLTFGLLILLRERITNGQPDRLRTAAKAHFYGSSKRWTRLVAWVSNVATRATMPYGIVGFAVLDLLPGVVVLGAIGAQIYWICLAVELRRLLLLASPRDGGRLARAS
jgi:phosphatidylglycerophosphate synthase